MLFNVVCALDGAMELLREERSVQFVNGRERRALGRHRGASVRTAGESAELRNIISQVAEFDKRQVEVGGIVDEFANQAARLCSAATFKKTTLLTRATRVRGL